MEYNKIMFVDIIYHNFFFKYKTNIDITNLFRLFVKFGINSAYQSTVYIDNKYIKCICNKQHGCTSNFYFLYLLLKK